MNLKLVILSGAVLALVLAAACGPAGAAVTRVPPSATSAPATATTAPPTAVAVLPTASPRALVPTTTASVVPATRTAAPATVAPTSAVIAGVNNSQTTAVAGRLHEIAATRAAQTLVPTTAPTRAADATQSVSAIATAYGFEAAAASQGVSLGTVIRPPLMVRDFTLPASTGGPLSLSDLNGRYRMIFYGYLHCPDFCPLTMAEFKRVKAMLGDLASEVTFIYISVDGARDTPQLIANYLDNFDPDFIGFSGDDATLAEIQPDYGFYYQRRLDTGSQAEYIIDHSTRSYLLDRTGRLRSSFTYDTEPEVIAAALRWYIENE